MVIFSIKIGIKLQVQMVIEFTKLFTISLPKRADFIIITHNTLFITLYFITYYIKLC